jgi:hypothetical protein
VRQAVDLATLNAQYPAADNLGNAAMVGAAAPYTRYHSDGTAWLASGGAAGTFTSRALTTADNGSTLVCGSAQVATVPAGLGAGFGVAVKGSITFANGAGVTVSDVRTSGAASPWCALVQTGVDAYDVVGGKA